MTHIVRVRRPDIRQTGGYPSQLARTQLGSWRTSLSLMGYHPCTPCTLSEQLPINTADLRARLGLLYPCAISGRHLLRYPHSLGTRSVPEGETVPYGTIVYNVHFEKRTHVVAYAVL